jgi:hypothetical protein
MSDNTREELMSKLEGVIPLEDLLRLTDYDLEQLVSKRKPKKKHRESRREVGHFEEHTAIFTKPTDDDVQTLVDVSHMGQDSDQISAVAVRFDFLKQARANSMEDVTWIEGLVNQYSEFIGDDDVDVLNSFRENRMQVFDSSTQEISEIENEMSSRAEEQMRVYTELENQANSRNAQVISSHFRKKKAAVSHAIKDIQKQLRRT